MVADAMTRGDEALVAGDGRMIVLTRFPSLFASCCTTAAVAVVAISLECASRFVVVVVIVVAR